MGGTRHLSVFLPVTTMSIPMITVPWDTAVTTTTPIRSRNSPTMRRGLMGALGYESMHVYGVSMGSMISQQLVVDHPEKVRKLTLSSPDCFNIRLIQTSEAYEQFVSLYVEDPSTPAGTRKEAEAILT